MVVVMILALPELSNLLLRNRPLILKELDPILLFFDQGPVFELIIFTSTHIANISDHLEQLLTSIGLGALGKVHQTGVLMLVVLGLEKIGIREELADMVMMVDTLGIIFIQNLTHTSVLQSMMSVAIVC